MAGFLGPGLQPMQTPGAGAYTQLGTGGASGAPSPGFLTAGNSSPYGGNSVGGLLTGSSSMGTNAANNAWQYGTYQPFNVNNPLAQTSFTNGAENTSLNGPFGQTPGLFGNQINSNLSNGSMGYNPNTTFLPGQYNSIYGGNAINQNTQNQYSNIMGAMAPQIAQYQNSNLTNEFAKGTLASTAGGYQTYGADQAVNSLGLNAQNQAFGQASQLANQQFGAAANTQQQGEQQAEFGPQYSTANTNSLLGNMINLNNSSTNQVAAGGNIGQQQGVTNVNAAVPGINQGNIQSNANSQFLNSLFGSSGVAGSLLGSGGLLGSVNGNSGGLLGSLLNAFGYTGTPGSMNTGNLNNLTGGSFASGGLSGSSYNQNADTDLGTSNSQLADQYGFGDNNTVQGG
jgi:hypothetical protein